MIELKARAPEDSRLAYEEIYAHAGLRQRPSFYLWLLSVLRPRPGTRLLDIACGEGDLVHFAAEQGVHALGVDFSRRAVQRARANLEGTGWMVADGEKLPFVSASFDYVTNIGSLEHFRDPYRGAAEMARVLKPGGRALVLLPNAFGLLGNVLHVLRTGDVFDDGQPIQRYATFQAWQLLLEGAGLCLERAVSYNEIEWPRTLRDGLWLISRPRKIARLLLTRLVPKFLSNHFVFVLTRMTTEGPPGAPQG